MPIINVLDSTISYRDTGAGRPVVFLHGNPASSFIWRNVVPEIASCRLLAPDLIGMGESGKPDIGYTFDDHARYLDAWFDELRLDDVVLVGHDWGGALAFDWAARHPDRVAGVAFLESVIRPLTPHEVSPQALDRTAMIRTPDVGESFVLEGDGFVRTAFTGGVRTPVDPVVMEAYLAPYPTSESRRPILTWARQLPLGDAPDAVLARLDGYRDWLATSTKTPKLLLTFDDAPTLLIGPEMAAWCVENIAAVETVWCGAAGHHAPEDQPVAIGMAIDAWLSRASLL